MGYRPNPFRRRVGLDEYPTVRFAVKAWALHQCVSFVVAGIVSIVFLVIIVSALTRPARVVPMSTPPPSQRLSGA
jgi:hypothetical protein